MNTKVLRETMQSWFFGMLCLFLLSNEEKQCFALSLSLGSNNLVLRMMSSIKVGKKGITSRSKFKTFLRMGMCTTSPRTPKYNFD